jgi:hypothetical protein
MNIFKVTTLAILLILTLAGFFFSMSNVSNTLAQGEMTPTPEITPSTVDLDLLDEFEQSLTYETGPNFVEDQPCELPCWWGMTPGITSKEEVIAILQNTGFYRNWNLTEYNIPFDSSEGPVGGSITLNLSAEVFAPFTIAFGAENGKLDIVRMQINSPNKWFNSEQFDLATILNQSKEEPMVYAYVSRARFHIILQYPNMLFFYSYYFIDTPSRYTTTEQGRVDGFIVCSRDDIIEEIEVVLFDPQNQELLDKEIYNSDIIFPLEERTLVDTETFITFFRENPEDCLEVPLRKQEK